MAQQYDGEVLIKAEIDTSDIKDGITDISDSFDDAGKSALSFSDIVKGNVLGSVIVGGLRELASGIKDIAGNFIDAAATVKAESSQFEQAFGPLQESATAAIGAVAKESGVLETRLNTLGAQIYSFARASGGDTTESMDLMATALQAAADNAAYYDKSLEDTVRILQSFLKGNFENDAALGLSATETTRNAAAMELFGAKFSELSEIQKQQTLLKMVTDAQALSGAMGQAAREADGWENVQGNLNEAWRQFQANVGAPLLESLVPIIQQITTALQEWTASIDWEVFSEKITGFVSTIVDNGPTIISIIAGVGAAFVAWNVVSMIQGVIGAVQAFKTANDGLKISQIALNAVMNANPLAIIVTLIAAVVTALITLWHTNEDFRNAVKAIWEDIKAFFAKAWEFIKEIWNATGIGGYFENIWNTIKGIFEVVKAVLSGDFEGAWEAIKGIVSGWATYFKEQWEKIKGIFSGAKDFFKDIGQKIIDGIKDGIKNAWSNFKGWVGDLFGGLFDGKLFGGNVNASNETSVTTNDINSDLSMPELSSFNIPALAQGAVIPPNREFLAVLGDQKSGTNIEAPLSTIEQALRNVLAERGGGSEIALKVSAKRGLARYLKLELDAEAMRQGGGLVEYDSVYA